MSNKSKIKMGSNRSFGLVFFVVFFIIGLWVSPDEKVQITFLKPFEKVLPFYLSLFFLILGLINSKILTPLNKLWFKFGILLGSIISPIIMAMIFFLVVTPTGIFMKAIGKDLLGKKYKKDDKSYWIKKNKTILTMKKQF